MNSFSEIVGERAFEAQAAEDKFNARLAAQIQSYWNARGYNVDVYLVREKFSNMYRCRPCCIRSNMLSGQPR